jgi:5-methylcytosine-specific restriction protein A
MSRAWAAGSSRAWRKVRAYVLERDGRVCRMLRPDGRQCGQPATTVNHRVSLAEGGPRLDPANLEAACMRCQLEDANAIRARLRGVRPVPRSWTW